MRRLIRWWSCNITRSWTAVAAAMLLVAGMRGHRVADPHARIALVDVAFSEGRSHETEEEMWSLHRMRSMLADRVASGTKHDQVDIVNAGRAGLCLSCRDACRSGMIDGVRDFEPWLGCVDVLAGTDGESSS